MKINNKYLLKCLKEIVKECSKNQSILEAKNESISNRFYLKIGRRMPEFLKENLLRPIYRGYKQKKELKEYIYSEGDLKKFSWSFLVYFLEHKVNFDLDLFKNEEDKKEIIKFARNKLFLALGGKILKNILLNKNDLEYSSRYNKFLKNNVKTKYNGETFILINKDKFILPSPRIAMSVFYHKYGLNIIPQSVRKNLKNKDFVDCGAFIGDSVLIFNELYPKKIYAFEPDSKNYAQLIKTIKLNRMKQRIIPVKKGVGERVTKLNIINRGDGSYLQKDKINSDSNNSKEVEITTIDKFANDNNLGVGLIKMDIEGYELEAIKGAEKTIKKNQPVLLICLYHTGKDFFEIPKLLKKWIPNYTFRFINLHKEHPIFERILVAYIKK